MKKDMLDSSPPINRSLEAEPEPSIQLLQWMWADAAVAPGTFFTEIAKVNPLRWSAKMPPEDLKRDLALLPSPCDRRIRLRLVGQTHELEFSCPESASRWIDEAQHEIRSQSQEHSLGLLNLHRIPFLVPMAIAIHLRVNAKTPWLQRNFFAAAAFARRVVESPRAVVKMQTDRSACRHQQSFSSWEAFHSSADQSAVLFVQYASKPVDERAPDAELSAFGDLWTCSDDTRFWSVFTSKSGNGSSVIVFRGGDGGIGDQCDHPGSPLRAFIHGHEAELPPPLPMETLKAIVKRVGSDASKPATITIVGFSMGGLPALACALSFGKCDDLPLHSLSRVILFNPATMFWPLWFKPPLLADDWWSIAPPASSAVISYVIKDDPLSEGLPGSKGFRAPIFPGHTVVLPPKYFGSEAANNHEFKNFL